MLTKIRIKNFKRFDDVDIELGKNVVFIGPNNSGKTTALQALALWEIGLRRWNEKRKGKSSAAQRQGVAINRRDLIPIPIPSANLIWRELHVRKRQQDNGQQQTQNIRIEITVSGITNGLGWDCGFEFDYANEESFYCRPLRLDDHEQPSRMSVPEQASDFRVAFLPPMSGLADREFIKQTGEIGVLIGQGQTAQVLRNLCYRVCWPKDPSEQPSEDWIKITEHIHRLFGLDLQPPKYIPERSEITMAYTEGGEVQMDLSSSGRGAQQTLLLLAHLYANPGTVLLLDEPDAHLEVLRQRQTYQLLSDVARDKGSQIIAASHSEVVMNEAANRGTVVAFVGRPHLMNDQGSQVIRALTNIGWDQYYQAEQTGWVLYVEDSTDLAILRAFAKRLNHPCAEKLEKVFVNYVTTNLPQRARDHFFGLQEGKPDLVGLALFDRLDKQLQTSQSLKELMWQRREIENYFCDRDVLMRWANTDTPFDLFNYAEGQKRTAIMQEAISEVTQLLTLDDKLPWSEDVKASDEVLDRVFRLFFRKMNLPLTFRKADYHELISLLEPREIPGEVSEKLDAILAIADSAKPREN